MAIRCRFVDSISASPTVRLDLNDTTGAGFWLGSGGLDAPPPSLRRAEASTILRDGGIVAASAYDNRTVTVPVTITSAVSMDARNTLVSSLVRELNRESNILEYRPDGSSTSYFFRTFRSPELEQAMWLAKQPEATVSLTLLAEPFAYGLMQTLSGTVNNDAANATNPMSLVFSNAAVLGDVDTPAQIKFTPNGAPVLAMKYAATAPALQFAQAEAGTVGTDTTVQVNDAAMSGAGSNYVRTTFATVSNRITRVSVTFPAGTSLRGQWRVFLRGRRTSGTDVNTVRAVLKGGPLLAVSVAGSTVTVPAGSTSPFWVDLGLFQMPIGEDPKYDGYSTTEMSIAAMTFAIEVGRTAGAGSFDSDVVMLVPADTTYCTTGSIASDVSFDGPNDSVYTLTSGALYSVPVARVGAIPALRPGSYNQLVFMRNATSTGIDTKTDTTALTVNYWPRYLVV